MASPSHVPVLLDRVVALLTPALGHEGAVLVDATLGLGGSGSRPDNHPSLAKRRRNLAAIRSWMRQAMERASHAFQ